MAQQKITQVHHIIKDQDLFQGFSSMLDEKFNSFKENFQTKKTTEWISRKEVGEILSISLVSVDAWTKKGILTAYRIGNKKRFKRNEVENALTKIEN